jgi:copper chaperone
MSEFTLHIDGMHCGSCVRRVSQALSQTVGVTVKEVRVGAARLESDQQPTPVNEAIAALAKAGFTAHPDPNGATVAAGN